MSDNQTAILVYLGKDGKTFGPFSVAEVEAMKISGEFYRYEWMWDGQSPNWVLVPPPAPPPPPPPPTGVQGPAIPPPSSAAAAAAVAATQAASSPQTQTQAQPAKPLSYAKETRTMEVPAGKFTNPASTGTASAADAPIRKTSQTFQALCHDYHRVVAGRAVEVTSRGCQMVCKDASLAPPFMKNSQVWMDLYDEPTDRSVTLRVTLAQLNRKGEDWVYDVSWENCPLL